MTNIEFVDELPDRPSRRENKRTRAMLEFVTALQQQPGCWAKYPLKLKPASVYARASQINSSNDQVMPVAFREGKFEAAARQGVLYVRALS